VDFISWFLTVAVPSGSNIVHSILIIVWDTFSIPLLLRTLFQPWKRDIVRPAQPGLQYIFQAWISNVMARFIGFFVRLVTIIIGLVAVLCTVIVGYLLYVIFILIPILVPLGIVLAIIFAVSADDKTIYFIIIGILILLGILLLVLYRLGSKNPPLKKPLEDFYPKLQQNPKLNWSFYFQEDARKIIESSQNWQSLIKNLLQSNKAFFILQRTGIDPTVIFKSVPMTLGEFKKDQFVLKSLEYAIKNEHERGEIGDIILAWISFNAALQEFFKHCLLEEEDLQNIILWQHNLWQQLYPSSPLLDPYHLKTTGGIGKEWAAGWTPLLSQYIVDISNSISFHQGQQYAKAHKETIEKIEEILARAGKHSVVLVGDPGVGKRSIVMGLAQKLLYGETLRPLRYKKVYELDLNRILAAAQSLEEGETLLVQILNEATAAGNIILFVDEIERILTGTEAGTLAAAKLIEPHIQNPNFYLLATTNFKSYHLNIESNPVLQKGLEKIEVSEPDEKMTIKVLCEIAPYIESRSKTVIPYSTLKEIIKLSSRFLANQRFPEKAIDLLDQVATFTATKKQDKIVRPEYVDEIIAQKTGVPQGQVEEVEKEKLLNLEEILHKRLVNQEEAVRAVSEAMRRSRAGVAKTNRPVGSFLFLGPTGVGKTETAKTLAEAYFGNEKTMIRFDMSEFQNINAASRLIGDEANPAGLLTSAVKERPFSLLLLDEIEKAHPNILNLFLQVLDEGRLTSATGETVDLTNCIIIATSNAGAEFIRQKISAGQQTNFKDELLNYLMQKGLFRPEFVNRFDEVVTFRPLTKEELVKVVEIMLGKLNLRLKEKDITVELDAGAKEKLAELGFDPQFGARALARVMQEKIENLVAQEILQGKLQKGQVLTITQEMI
jgi:ATP-dependent Clp protease ATP-binding subunit ClpC